MSDPDLNPFSQLPRALRQEARRRGEDASPLDAYGQRKLLQMAMDAKLDAEFVNRRWYYRRSRLPAIYAALVPSNEVAAA